MLVLKTKVTAIALAIIGVSGALAHSGATGIVKQRMDAMVEIGDATKAIGDMLRGKSSFDLARVEAASATIMGHAGEKLISQFPEGSLDHPTEAKPAIWQDGSQFETYALELEMAAAELSKRSAGGAEKAEIAKAFAELAGTCKACHESYRIQKD